MINSMTGFGRCEYALDIWKITVEMKSVNHRYLDVNLKMPRRLNPFESDIRKILKNYLQRGKLDVYVSCECTANDEGQLRYNAALAGEYVSYFKQMEQEFDLRNDLSVTALGRCPDVLVMEEENGDEEQLWECMKEALNGACEQMIKTRNREGETLALDLLDKLQILRENVCYIIERSPELVTDYRKKLEKKVSEILIDSSIDKSRIAAEVVIYADKVCVDEETVRLSSHIDHMEKVLHKGGYVGRKLDFIAQEMNREANTILSKANDLEIANRGIELKTEIEKIREQIQNLE